MKPEPKPEPNPTLDHSLKFWEKMSKQHYGSLNSSTSSSTSSSFVKENDGVPYYRLPYLGDQSSINSPSSVNQISPNASNVFVYKNN
jgi:hypothetical protein